MNPNQPPDSHPPLGILFLMEPEYCDLIEDEHRFSELMRKAWEEGTLFLPQTELVQ